MGISIGHPSMNVMNVFFCVYLFVFLFGSAQGI